MAHAPRSRRTRMRHAAVAAAGCFVPAFVHPAAAQGRTFRFLVVNDLHHASPECDPFMRALVEQMSSRDTPLLTNACCSRVRDNHDGGLEEGCLVCTAGGDGRPSWEFLEFRDARAVGKA